MYLKRNHLSQKKRLGCTGFSRHKVFVNDIKKLWSVGTGYAHEIAQNNSGLKYLLRAADCLSMHLSAEMLKTKDAT